MHRVGGADAGRMDVASEDHEFGARFVEKLQMRGGRAVSEPSMTCARNWMSMTWPVFCVGAKGVSE